MAELTGWGFLIISSYDLNSKHPECKTRKIPCGRNSIHLSAISSNFPDRLSLTFYSRDTRENGFLLFEFLFDFHRLLRVFRQIYIMLEI